MSDCATHLRNCLRDAVNPTKRLPRSADPDARQVHRCIHGLDNIAAWQQHSKRNRYAARCHQLYAQLRRDGVAYTACVLLSQAETKAKPNEVPDWPEFVLLAHLLACLASDLVVLRIVEEDRLQGQTEPIQETIGYMVDCLCNQSVEEACIIGLRALAISEWFKRYAESMLKVKREQAQDRLEYADPQNPMEDEDND